MKKTLIRMIIALAFSSVVLSSCSLEYREHRRTEKRNGNDHDHDHNDHDRDNRNYNRN